MYGIVMKTTYDYYWVPSKPLAEARPPPLVPVGTLLCGEKGY